MSIEYIGDIKYDDKVLNKDEKLIIFGAGIQGRKALEYLEKTEGKKNIICFCDSNKGLTSDNIRGIPICSPAEACKRYPDAIYLIGGKYSRQMYGILKDNLIDRIHILVI